MGGQHQRGGPGVDLQGVMCGVVQLVCWCMCVLGRLFVGVWLCVGACWGLWWMAGDLPYLPPPRLWMWVEKRMSESGLLSGFGNRQPVVGNLVQLELGGALGVVGGVVVGVVLRSAAPQTAPYPCCPPVVGQLLQSPQKCTAVRKSSQPE